MIYSSTLVTTTFMTVAWLTLKYLLNPSVKKYTKKTKPAATVTTPNDKQFVTISKNDENLSSEIQVPTTSQSTQNIMQMYHQNPVGLFMDANITNCTINVNVPK